ncbi:MAG: murein biosynthesis integral membrane protein MurJ, partial [Bdellovibrionota bacterium]
LKKFAMTALAPCFFNIAMIAAALVSGRVGTAEDVLAWAVIVGGLLQMLVLVPGVVRAGYFPRLNFRWNSPDVLRVFKSIVPSIFGMSIMQITAIVNMYFTSHLPSGSQSYLYFADRILELPLSMFVVSVGTALLPTLSRYNAEGNRQAMSDTINHYIRLIMFVALPAAVGMFVLAQPIVNVLFLGREFKYADAIATAQIIQVYSFSVIVAAGVRILAQGFYAVQNTWFPALAGGVALITHVIFATALTKTFGLPGLAAASVCSALVNLLMLATAYRAWIGTLQLGTLAKRILLYSVCAAVMFGVLATHDYLLRFVGPRVYSRAFVLLVVITLGGIAYMLTANLLRIPEYRETSAMFTEKIARRLKKLRKR